MSPQRIGAIVAAFVVTPWAVVVIALYVFRLLVCADTDLQRETSPCTASNRASWSNRARISGDCIGS